MKCFAIVHNNGQPTKYVMHRTTSSSQRLEVLPYYAALFRLRSKSRQTTATCNIFESLPEVTNGPCDPVYWSQTSGGSDDVDRLFSPGGNLHFYWLVFTPRTIAAPGQDKVSPTSPPRLLVSSSGGMPDSGVRGSGSSSSRSRWRYSYLSM